LGISELFLSSVVRLASDERLFPGAGLDATLAFVSALAGRPNVLLLNPGPRHWALFLGLCRETGARGKLVADACHAALAIETGCEFVTFDRDFARFPGLRTRAPF
jgi:predicted nucleic acid-binding protein